jgi:serine/threonine transporter
MMLLIKKWNQLSLVKRIVCGLVTGIILALLAPKGASIIIIFGTLFIGLLKSIAPALVFFLVISAISQHKTGEKTNLKSIIVLYILGTILAALVAVIASSIFPITLQLVTGVKDVMPPSGIGEVVRDIIMKIADNPINGLVNANYVGVLFWAILGGIALKKASTTTKTALTNFSDAISQVVRWIINLAPYGVMGLVFNSIVTYGLGALAVYIKLLIILVGCMLFVALVINPLIAFFMIRTNPYPLVFRCLRESGITAFFTRSSAANIPVNMNLCDSLKLHKDTYSVSIPLGATINMAGAAVTISVLTLAATHTLGIQVDFFTAIILSILAAVSACGSAGVAGGSLLLIPLACSLFGIPNDVSMQVVGVGFVIGVIQDSCETGLNSSTDVLFTAVAEYREWRKHGRKNEIPNKFFPNKK